MRRSNERSEMFFDRSQHELDQLRFYCMDHDTEKATLRARLDKSDQQLTYYHRLCREQEATIKDLRSQLEVVALRDERDVRRKETGNQHRPLDRDRETNGAKATSRKRYRAPTVESVSDEESGDPVPSEQQPGIQRQRLHKQDTTNQVLEVFLTFVSVTDSRMSKRQAVYVRQQQPLRDVLGPKVFGQFRTVAMAFVYKAQQIRDVGQTAAQVSTLPTHTFCGRVS